MLMPATSTRLVNGRHPAFWRHNDAWRERQVEYLSADAQAWVRRGAAAVERSEGYRAANSLVAATAVALRSAAIAYDEDEIQSLARRSAYRCSLSTMDHARELADSKGLTLPTGPNVTDQGIYARLRDERYWRRQLRAIYGRRAECAFRDLGRVHRHADPYVTNDGLARHVQQRARARHFLESHDLVCEQTGEALPLSEIAARSIAAECNRRRELMHRIRGFEEHAASDGHTWDFYTLTVPSAYHVRLAASGAPNPTYERSTVRQARDLLQQLWARVRAKAKRLTLDFYGFRMAEPHHDGTPHWHILMFGPARDLDAFWACIQEHWLSIHRSELVSELAIKARCHRERANASKGTAAGYVAKYVAKGIDGHALVDDDAGETDLPGADAALRVVAWARLHGIRQFQQIGGPRIGIYRELRRLREPVEYPEIERARLASNSPDFADYWRACAGIVLDKERPQTVDRFGAPVPKLNAWGELPTDRVVGVRCIGTDGRTLRVCTRLFSWVRTRRLSAPTSDLGPVGIIVRGSGDCGGRAAHADQGSSHLSPRQCTSDRSARLTCAAGWTYGPTGTRGYWPEPAGPD